MSLSCEITVSSIFWQKRNGGVFKKTNLWIAWMESSQHTLEQQYFSNKAKKKSNLMQETRQGSSFSAAREQSLDSSHKSLRPSTSNYAGYFIWNHQNINVQAPTSQNKLCIYMFQALLEHNCFLRSLIRVTVQRKISCFYQTPKAIQ